MTNRSRRIRNIVLSVSSAGALLAVAALPAGSAFAQTIPAVQTIAGSTRMGTAIAVANQEYPGGPSSHTVIIASGANANLVDSVTAAPLAKALGAPILLSESPSILTDVVKAYLTTHSITTVYLVGADANAALKAKLPSTVTSVTELSGATRYDTAAAIAQALLKVTGQTSFSTVFVASGEDPDLSDALAAAPFAANLQAPILFSAPNSATLPGNEAALVTNQANQTLYVVGAATGYGLQSSDTITDVGSATGTTFANAVAVAQKFAPSSGYTTIDLGNDSQTDVVNANGLVSYHLVDAITGGPLAAMDHAAIVFADGTTITPSTEAFLEGSDAHGVSTVNIFGGPASIPTSTGSQVAQYVVQGVPTVPTLSAIAVTGESFGTGSITAPAVANTTTPVKLSATLAAGTPASIAGVNLTLTINGPSAPLVSTSSGADLSPATSTSGSWTFSVPTTSTGQATVEVTLPSGESGSYTAQFAAPFTVNGSTLTDATTYLEFVAPDSLATAPYGTPTSPYTVATSTASSPSAGVIPVTVTLPSLNGAAQVNVPVTLTRAQESNHAPNFNFTDAQGTATLTTLNSSGVQDQTAYTNSNGQAVFYVSSTSAGWVAFNASANGVAVPDATALAWGQTGVPDTIASITATNTTSTRTGLQATDGSTVTFTGTVEDAQGNPVPNAEILVTSDTGKGSYVINGTATAFPAISPQAGASVSSTGAPYGTLVKANSSGQFSVSVTGNNAASVQYSFSYVQNDQISSVAARLPLLSTTISYVAPSGVPTKVEASASLVNPISWTTPVSGIDVPANGKALGTVAFDAENSAGQDSLSVPSNASGSVTYEVSTTNGADITNVDGKTLPSGVPPATVATIIVAGNGTNSTTDPAVTVDGLPLGNELPIPVDPAAITVGVTDGGIGAATVTAAVANATSADATIDFTASAPTKLSVSPSVVTINPGGSYTETLTVEDGSSNPVANTAVPLSLLLSSQKDLWITAVNGKQLTTTAVYGGTSYANASTPIPLYSPSQNLYNGGSTGLAYSGVNVANAVSWSGFNSKTGVSNPIYLYTNSQGQVTVTLTAGGVGYLGVVDSQGKAVVTDTSSNPASATISQTAYWGFSNSDITLTSEPAEPADGGVDGTVNW